MNANSTSTRIYLAMTRRRYAWLAAIPVAALLIAGITWGIQEWAAAREIRLQFAQWGAAGIPFSNETMETAYVRRTHPEGTADWTQIIRLTDWGVGANGYARIPYQGSEGKSPDELTPGGDVAAWPDQAFVASYLEEMELVIGLVAKASQHPQPVRFPIKFDGFNTLLPQTQESRSILRLLALDCDYAYFKQDTVRALRDLMLMQSTAAAFDSRDTMIAELIQIALRGMRLGAIRRTMTHCIWSEGELTKIRDSLAPQKGLGQFWKEVVYHDRALALTAIDESPSVLSAMSQRPSLRSTVWPSEKRLLIEYYEEVAQLLFDAPDRWKQQATALGRNIQSKFSEDSLVSMLLPACIQVVEAEIRSEEHRRWTLTAVALQQYKHQHGQWPQGLSDLKTIGLSRDDYSTVAHELFGYEVDDTTAYLWTRSHDSSEKTEHISPTRPVPKEGEERLWYLLELKTSTALPSLN